MELSTLWQGGSVNATQKDKTVMLGSRCLTSVASQYRYGNKSDLNEVAMEARMHEEQEETERVSEAEDAARDQYAADSRQSSNAMKSAFRKLKIELMRLRLEAIRLHSLNRRLFSVQKSSTIGIKL